MSSDLRILIASKGNPAALAAGFREAFPEAEILTEPDRRPVPYVVAGKPDPGFLATVPGLELVLSLNAGIEHLVVPGEVPEDVPIVRLVDPAMTEGMSDWVLATVMWWHRNLDLYSRDDTWTRRPEILSRDRVVTVLGAGALGGRVAGLLVAVGFRTRVWSRSGRPVEGAETFDGDALTDAITGADAVINLLPLTERTRGILNGDLFARMNPGGLVANAGRGAHVVDADLIEALDAGRPRLAALDVFRTEPLPEDHPFWGHPGVLVTPHVAAPTQAGSAVRIMADNIRRHRAGVPLCDVVRRDLGY